jgi:hypothetical protein
MQTRHRRYVLLLITAIAFLTGCPGEDSGNGGFQVFAPEKPAPAVNRTFGINISESDQGFASDFGTARQAGIQVVELNIPWDYLEPTAGNYQDPAGLLPATAFYGANNIQVAFSIAVIDTVADRRPGEFKSSAYDSTEVITAFKALLDWFMGQVPADVTIPGISIGNEVDLFLDDSNWTAYTEFFRQISEYIDTTWPGIKVGVKTTVMHGVLGDGLTRLKNINQYSDVVMLTYYPQNDRFQVLEPTIVHTHLQQIEEAFKWQDIWLMEVGYQSGQDYGNSSEARQAEFYHEFFKAWDDRRSYVRLAVINWLNDQAPEQVAEWETYYGSSDPGFVEYLSTLGLRHHDGTNKYAWLQILAETGARGW